VCEEKVQSLQTLTRWSWTTQLSSK